MIGLITMEISEAEHRKAVQYYLNEAIFEQGHEVVVIDIAVLPSGRVVVKLQGSEDVKKAGDGNDSN